MSANPSIRRAVRLSLMTGVVSAVATVAPVSLAQDIQVVDEVVVTGSRIQRNDYVANSPVLTTTAEQIQANADVTLDTYLNTLPQVNPAGGTTSNNPGNGGQSNINLRGLGANRNLVLIDGRRVMPSSSSLTVDLNTLPQALIESVEIVTGGAGAVYGADAVAGAVNFRLKQDYEGLEVRGSFSNSTEEWDAEEYNVSLLGGMNFAGGRGNVVGAFDFSKRELMIKSQRDFAAVATSTTSFLPEGFYITGGNAPTQESVDALFAGYVPGYVPGSTNPSLLSFNTDGSLFSVGVFNSPNDVLNFRYPVDLNVNQNLFPDLYSYNFDSVNVLTLPLERKSFMGRGNFEFDNGVELFGQVGWTEYESSTALAATPFPTVSTAAPGENSPIQAVSNLVEPTKSIGTNLIIPLNNRFIPDDLKTLLDTRTGDNPALVGSGANEAILIRQRSLSVGLRQSAYENTVMQALVGARGPLFGDSWRWEAYYSQGRTSIDETQSGNLDTQRLLDGVAAEVGNVTVCEGGLNFFGRNPLSQDCINYIQVPPTTVENTYDLRVAQGFVSGKVGALPGGPISLVAGLEGRWFEYEFVPGASGGPISGLNARNPAKGNNQFMDLFSEALFPVTDTFEVSLGYRLSRSEFEDEVKGMKSDTSSDNAYKVEASWAPVTSTRLRASYQRAVRAPNFGELFDGGGSNPQYFDPCTVTTAARNGPNAAALRQLCINTGLTAGIADVYVQTPGNQIALTTAGNINLKPETADTITAGVVFSSPWSGAMAGFQGSLDYYQIDIADPILSPSANLFVASCYNYFGTNPNYEASNRACQGIRRAGTDIQRVNSPDDPVGQTFPGINGGKITTDGIDLQLNYTTPLPVGDLNVNYLLNYLLSFEQSDSPELPSIDYKGTISYFGAGLGTSFPEMRMQLGAQYLIGDFGVDARVRWIDKMDNRAAVQFPGETFGGVPSITYVDLSASWRFMEKSSLRIGVNNVMDKQPPRYAPNVQSGTDPSTYDVIGRRIFGQVTVGF